MRDLSKSATTAVSKHGGRSSRLYFALASTVRSLPNTHTAYDLRPLT